MTLMGLGHSGPRRGVQQALGWTPDPSAKSRSEVAPCPTCGAELRFDVRDPENLGRTMEACSNRSCPESRPHLVRPDARIEPLKPYVPKQRVRQSAAQGAVIHELLELKAMPVASARPATGPRAMPRGDQRAKAAYKLRRCLVCGGVFQPTSSRALWCQTCPHVHPDNPDSAEASTS